MGVCERGACVGHVFLCLGYGVCRKMGAEGMTCPIGLCVFCKHWGKCYYFQLIINHLKHHTLLPMGYNGAFENGCVRTGERVWVMCYFVWGMVCVEKWVLMVGQYPIGLCVFL